MGRALPFNKIGRARSAMLLSGVLFLFVAGAVGMQIYLRTPCCASTPSSSNRERPLLYVVNRALKELEVVYADSGQLAFRVALRAEVLEATLLAGAKGSFVYVTDIGEDNIISIEASDGRVYGTYPSASGTFSLAPHPNGRYVYAINSMNRSVTIIDDADHKELKREFQHEGTFYLGEKPLYGVFTPDARFWYTDAARKSVGVVRVNATVAAIAPWEVTVKVTSLAEIALDSIPSDITTAGNGSLVLVGLEHSVEVLNASTYSVIANIPLAATPSHIISSFNSSYYYVASSAGVYVIDASSYQVRTTITMTGGAYGLAEFAPGQKLYASNPEAGTVTIVSTATLQAIETVTVGGTPVGLALFSRLEVNQT